MLACTLALLALIPTAHADDTVAEGDDSSASTPADPLAPTTDVSTAADLEALKERVRTLERQLDDEKRAAAAEQSQEIPLDLETRVHGYAAINAIYYEQNPLGLSLDQLVLGYSANLDRKYTFYSEVSFDPGELDTGIDLDNLEVKLNFKDTFNVVVGRSNTPLSEWSDGSLHGAYRYTPVVLPEVLALEQADGLIPVHLVGVQLRGVAPIGFWQLGYVADVSNGRSPLLGGVAQVGDSGWGKGLLGRVWVESPSGLRVGVAGSYDLVEPQGGEDAEDAELADGETAAVDEPTTEILGAASVATEGGRLEVLGEGFTMIHQEEGGSAVINFAGYALVGYHIKALTPYVIVDMKKLDADDPIYQHFDEVASEVKGSLGARYDLGLRVALKGQVDLVHEQIYTGPDAGTEPGGAAENSVGFHLQLAAGF